MTADDITFKACGANPSPGSWSYCDRPKGHATDHGEKYRTWANSPRLLRCDAQQNSPCCLAFRHKGPHISEHGTAWSDA